MLDSLLVGCVVWVKKDGIDYVWLIMLFILCCGVMLVDLFYEVKIEYDIVLDLIV